MNCLEIENHGVSRSFKNQSFEAYFIRLTFACDSNEIEVQSIIEVLLSSGITKNFKENTARRSVVNARSKEFVYCALRYIVQTINSKQCLMTNRMFTQVSKCIFKIDPKILLT